jgi:hypothetical protein
MAAALTRPVRGVMTPPDAGTSRHLLHVRPGVSEAGLHAELRLVLWMAVGVIALVLWLAHALGIH